MAVTTSLGNRRILVYILTAAPLALLLILSLRNPSLPGQARNYVVSHLPLSIDTSVAVSLASELEGSPEQAPGPTGTGPAKADELGTAVSAVPEVPSEYLKTSKAAGTGKPKAHATTTRTSKIHSTATASPAAPTVSGLFDTLEWFFQFDIDGYPLPKFPIGIEKLRNYPPHNYKGPGQKVFATFFATRNGTLKDPYFLTAQQIVYRLLWDEKIKTDKPVVVFVPPFVPQEQRDYFTAAGAIVREVEVREFTPHDAGYVPERLKDMFTKLEMWRQTDFERIMYLDSDAVPFRNLDPIFDLTKEQRCVKRRLPKEDRKYASSICDYVFAAWPESSGHHQLNAGVMVLKPNMPMYQRLVRESSKPDQHKWDDGIMEQAFLDFMFSYRTAFPSRNLSIEWNGGVMDEKKHPRVVHGKLWSYTTAPKEQQWVLKNYNKTWDNLVKFYESDEFLKMRTADLKLALGDATEKEKAQDDTQKDDLEKDDTPEDGMSRGDVTDELSKY